jgi:hypothetical protein
MVDLNAYLVPKLGYYAEPYGVGLPDDGWKAVQVGRSNRVAWVPDGVKTEMKLRTGKYDGTLNSRVILLPASAKTLQTYGYPEWMDTQEKRAWWEDYHNAAQKYYQYMVNGYRETEAVKMFNAQATAAFWERAYQISDTLKAPGRYLLAGLPLVPLAIAIGFVVVLLRRKPSASKD